MGAGETAPTPAPSNASPDERLAARIGQWRAYVQRRSAISAGDVDELEDHLRERIDELRAVGLDDDEAFLVAIRRMGSIDAVSGEFAREHSERLWKQLVVVPDAPVERGQGAREIVVALTAAVLAGGAMTVAFHLLSQDALALNAIPIAFPFLAAYFAWKRRLGAGPIAVMAGAWAVLVLVLNLYPFAPGGSTQLLAVIHTPVVLWLLLGLAYTGGRWRSGRRRMDFVRFTGELVIYVTLLAIGGAVLLGLVGGVLSFLDVDIEPLMQSWILPMAVPGAVVVAAWLVEAKQNVVENIAPVLTRVFTPLTTIALVAVLAVFISYAGSGRLVDVDRGLLMLMDAILVLVLCLMLYSASARDPLAPPGPFDVLQLVLAAAALAVDGATLVAMAARIAEFGASPNKVAALGLNLLLAVHLVWTGWLTASFARRRSPFAAIETWHTQYLPIYGVWAALVVLAFGPLFAFA